MNSGTPVPAAGGVLWRTRGGAIEVALVHRARYDDWSLPKGKLAPGESELLGAVREVREETGAEVAVSRRIATVGYDVADGMKRVGYWSMHHRGGTFAPSAEVDELVWVGLAEAADRLPYATDRSVLGNFAAVPVPDSVLLLVRHAKAGKSSAWRGDDRLRPLDDTGREQALELVPLLSCFAPDRVHSADLVRCEQTVEPLAAELGLRVQSDPLLSDATYTAAPQATLTAVLSLAKPGRVSVVCSQGTTVPALVDRLGPGLRSADTKKGAWWVLTLVDGDVVSADHYDAPRDTRR